MEWLIVLVCLLLIGSIPLGICAQYDQGEAQAWIIVGPLRFPIYPRRTGKAKKRAAGKTKSKDSFESHAQVKKKSRSFTDYFPILQLVLDFLIDFRAKLRINELRFKAILAGGDPCDLSINYGRAWAALGNIMPLLERCFVIKKRNLEIACDYTADVTQITGYVNMTITASHILMIGVYHGAKLLRKYFQIINNAKDGATS